MADERVFELEALSQSLQAAANSVREARALLAARAPDPQVRAELQTLRRAGRDLLAQIDRLTGGTGDNG